MFVHQYINTPESFLLDKTRIARVFELVQSVPHAQNGTLNIAWLFDEEIQILNRDHRGIDKTTDVLSFHYFDDFSVLSTTDIVGEIILSESRIISQAEEHNHSPQKESEILILHSILHILGYDHETDEDYAEMWKWEGKMREMI